MNNGQYILTGTLHPERATFSGSATPIEISFEGVGLKFTILNNQISAHVSLHNFSDNQNTLKNRVTNFINAFVNLVALNIACPYSAEIISITNCETGIQNVYSIYEPIFDNDDFTDDAPLRSVELSTEHIILSVKDVVLQRAMSDFKSALALPNDTSFYCFRAIESLRHHFAGDKSSQWEKMRESLKIDKLKISAIQDYADALRHGQSIPQNWEQRKADLITTHEIIKRYISYRLNKPIDDYYK